MAIEIGIESDHFSYRWSFVYLDNYLTGIVGDDIFGATEQKPTVPGDYEVTLLHNDKRIPCISRLRDDGYGEGRMIGSVHHRDFM